MGAIVSEHLRRTGIAAPSRGGHLLRHSLATRLVNAGVPIKTIADVLGHQSIDTTAPAETNQALKDAQAHYKKNMQKLYEWKINGVRNCSNLFPEGMSGG